MVRALASSGQPQLPMSKRILVVEDEPRIQRLVCDNLEAEGYKVIAVDNGESGLEQARSDGVDLILLDVMLPGIDGFEVCRRLREEGVRTPVLFLTARDLPRDRVAGLHAGGEDYLVKPFHLDELLARIEAILRRAGWNSTTVEAKIKIGQGWVDLETHEACAIDGTIETLPRKELGILRMLIEARGGIVSRNEILDKIWGTEADPTPRTVDNFVVRLRKRFEQNANDPAHLLTVRGVGYRLK